MEDSSDLRPGASSRSPPGQIRPPSQPFEHHGFKFRELSREIRDMIYEFYLADVCHGNRLSAPSFPLSTPLEVMLEAFGVHKTWQLDQNLTFPYLTRRVEVLMLASKEIKAELMEAILRRPITWRGSLTSTKWQSFKKNLLPHIGDLTITAGPGITVTRPWNDLDNEIRRLLQWVHRRVSMTKQTPAWKLKKLRLIGMKPREYVFLYRPPHMTDQGDLPDDWTDHYLLQKIRDCGVQVELVDGHPTEEQLEVRLGPVFKEIWMKMGREG